MQNNVHVFTKHVILPTSSLCLRINQLPRSVELDLCAGMCFLGYCEMLGNGPQRHSLVPYCLLVTNCSSLTVSLSQTVRPLLSPCHKLFVPYCLLVTNCSSLTVSLSQTVRPLLSPCHKLFVPYCLLATNCSSLTVSLS